MKEQELTLEILHVGDDGIVTIVVEDGFNVGQSLIVREGDKIKISYKGVLGNDSRSDPLLILEGRPRWEEG